MLTGGISGKGGSSTIPVLNKWRAKSSESLGSIYPITITDGESRMNVHNKLPNPKTVETWGFYNSSIAKLLTTIGLRYILARDSWWKLSLEYLISVVRPCHLLLAIYQPTQDTFE